MLLPQNQPTVIKDVIDGLLHPTHPICSQVVVIPGFDQDEFANCLLETILSRDEPPTVAVVSADEVGCIDDFVALLHRQWRDRHMFPKFQADDPPVLRLKFMMESLAASRPCVQILKRFDTILDSLDATVLAHLRTAEQRKGLRTVTLLPVPYDEMKRRWEQRGNKLTTSDYGVSPMHAKHVLLPAQSPCECPPLPPHLLNHAFALTGGFPRYFEELTGLAIRNPDLHPADLKRKMRDEGHALFRELIKELDANGDRVLRQHVINLYLRVECDDSRFYLQSHPISWGTILLSDDQSTLRAECLGPAALAQDFDEAVIDPSDLTAGNEALRRAENLYERKQFADAARWTQKVPWGDRKPEIQLLRKHAEIMSNLYAGVGGDDSDWEKVSDEIENARGLFARLVHAKDTPAAAVVERGYMNLKAIASSVTSVAGLGETRIVDCLAGLRRESKFRDDVAALAFLKLMVDSAQAIPGASSACQAVLVLPEQIYRVWGYWKLGVNYYTDYDTTRAEWDDVEKVWPDFSRRSPEKTEFPNSETFAYFCLARFLREDGDAQLAPASDFAKLKKDLAMCGIRRDAAHAVIIFNDKQREKFFDVIIRWFGALVLSCPTSVTIDDVSERISPLPIPSDFTEGILRP